MTAEQTAPTRTDRRRERTRNALLGAARKFLSEGQSAVSIKEITDAADVGFGSFYNHFDSKEQLFDEAVQSALKVYNEMRDHIVARYDDPAEIFAVSFRLTGRLQRQLPEMVRVVLHSGMGVMLRDQGLAPSARQDIIAAQEAGRFEPMDPDLAIMAAGGALLGLLQLLDAKPDADAAALADEMTYRALRMFGMNKRSAERLSSAPLPELPTNPDLPLQTGT
ncbi:TetR/AcrR family transcriptional regulator [Nocardia asteroides]|uniref:TetR family transcriptional regulator n=1 Tax=Nocardia asteroides NBRC 15531 TaxID=1110697 RepID=U5EEZ6_NOCAS|nr:TetR/AcrR family transcriptional regulator [Nocardia asteroides]UGT51186.1 TetR/AcrR family transcriptional regulator; helix-turn-helix transcriptional regulator [Nocardia asteroides]GAD85900.1 putative TetR family transcriptional regulator [Nocardia asteroides NBRC 15531]SFM32749.1 transcriptional regulator, TetR family [Nocardia asteroides]VEG35933.1 Probable acrEF/envCD operon repressor [Nocardia asteroides]